MRTLVHGDDYIIVGHEQDLKWLEARLQDKYDIKTKMLGPNEDHNQEVRVFNRIITWEQSGIGCEADPGHVEIIVKELGLETCTPVATLGASTEGRTKEDHQEPLDERQQSQYRAIVARADYIAFDRADVAYAVKVLAKAMAKPTRADWDRLKRLGRYLAGRPRMQIMYEWQSTRRKLTTYSDADWAGDKQIRKSTSGGCLVIGKHLIKGWSKTQALVAFRSAESELYATLRTSAETLGIFSMAKDMGYTLAGCVWGDASAALGIIHRKGLGRTRHIDTSYLWVQQVAAERRLSFAKVLGRENLADLYAKHLDISIADKHVWKLNCKYIEGRSNISPELHTLSISWDDYMRAQPLDEVIHLETLSGAIWGRIACEHEKKRGKCISHPSMPSRESVKYLMHLKAPWKVTSCTSPTGLERQQRSQGRNNKHYHYNNHYKQCQWKDGTRVAIKKQGLSWSGEAVTGHDYQALRYTTTVRACACRDYERDVCQSSNSAVTSGWRLGGGVRDIQGICRHVQISIQYWSKHVQSCGWQVESLGCIWLKG